eukprot:COSAG02_NODE_4652_length_5132_cov_2.838069_2_plen_67_part_00
MNSICAATPDRRRRHDDDAPLEALLRRRAIPPEPLRRRRPGLLRHPALGAELGAALHRGAQDQYSR